MATAIRMPQPGQMTEECTVLQWFKQEGDTIAKGDPLFEIETDKSNMEIEAFDEGTLLKVLAAEGETVPVDAVVAWIGQPGEDVPAADVPKARASASPGATGAGPSETAAGPSESSARDGGEAPSPSRQVGASSSHEAAGLDGRDGATGAIAPESAGDGGAGGRRLAISPRASRLAAELGVDPRSVRGTGPGGRIVERDVRASGEARVSEATATRQPTQIAETGAPAEGPARSPEGGEPLSRLRQVIARRLTESVTTIPHFTVTVAADMTDLLALRTRLKAAGSPISVTDLIHAATVQALVELPLVNAVTDGRTLWRRESVHLGIAVSIPDGLLVPVVRDAQDLSVRGLHDRGASVIAAARAGTLGPDELSGSTFTVTNMGMFGVEEFSAIINPGESAILAVSSVRPEPAVFGEGIAIRQMMRLTLSADHRLVDGELGARFLNAVKRRLEDADGFGEQVGVR